MTTRAVRERRLLATLSLTLLALVGAIAAITVSDRRAAADVAVVAPSPDAVSRIAIERPGRDPLVLERSRTGGGEAGATTAADTVTTAATTSSTDDGTNGRIDALSRAADGWRLVAPCAIDANDARIAPLLDALSGARLDYAAGDVDLEAAGLAAPLATVRLDGTTVALGGTDLGGERRYALVGERVALVPEWTLSLVEGGLSALAEPAPFTAPPTRLRRLEPEPASGAAGTSDLAAGTADAADASDVPELVPGASGTPTLDAAAAELDPGPWGDLAANQVVVWPVADAPTTTRRARFEATFASGETRIVELVGNATWNAIPSEDGRCARLFADADLPADAYP